MRVLLCSPYLNVKGIHRGGINIWADNILQYYQSLNDVEIEIVPISFDRKYYITTNTGTLKRIYLGVKELSVAVNRVEKEINKRQYDVIHICTSASLSLLKDLQLLRLAKKYRVKSVVHLHFGRTPNLIQEKNWEWKLLKKVIQIADSVITMDKFTYDVLKQEGYSNIYYCPNPLSMAIMNQIATESTKYVRQANKLLFVGHVIPSKGVYELVEACSRLDNIELHVIGKVQQSIANDLQLIASGRGDGNWLILRGEVSHDDVLREMMSAALFVFPSYTEGFPNVILESMACSCPIAASSVGAIPEMLDLSGKPCGECYPPHSVEGIYTCIRKLLYDDQLRNHYATIAKERVYKMYAVDEVWKNLINIWRNNDGFIA